jgi:hypothetical protein
MATTTDWTTSALKAVAKVAKKRDRFTTDDIWPLVETTDSPTAMGYVMREAAQRGIIKRTAQTVPSRRAVSHSRPVRVWKSTKK